MAIKQGWHGRVYEDFEVGDVYQHPAGRTITQTEYKKPLVDSTLTLAIVTGLSVSDISQNAVNPGRDEVRLPNPVFDGDTIYAQSKVLDVRGWDATVHSRFSTEGVEGSGSSGRQFVWHSSIDCTHGSFYTGKAKAKFAIATSA